MCLIFNKKPATHIAEEDITVYKVFRKVLFLSKYFMRSVFHSHYYFRYKKLKPISLNAVHDRNVSRYWYVYEGYYSFPSLKAVNDYFGGELKGMLVRECIIPKGSTYYKEIEEDSIYKMHGEIASETLIIKW